MHRHRREHTAGVRAGDLLEAANKRQQPFTCGSLREARNIFDALGEMKVVTHMVEQPAPHAPAGGQRCPAGVPGYKDFYFVAATQPGVRSPRIGGPALRRLTS